MSLSDDDKARIKALWGKISKSADAIGAEALGRMLHLYPQTKTYFTHWPDMKFGGESVKAHGKRVMGGVALAVSKLDTMNAALLDLSEKHAFKLRVDPANFKLLSHCILVVMAMMFPKEFTAEAHTSMDKFLINVAWCLSERFR